MPRFRSIVWRELPPFVRRSYVWAQRRLWIWEMRLGRLYLSWKAAPAWNFVAIAGTFGILLTILLFLTGQDLSGVELAADDQSWYADSKLAAPWEIDSRWDARRIRRPHTYAVEIEFAKDRRVEIVEQPRHRHRPTSNDFEFGIPPKEPEHKPDPGLPLESQGDWFAQERPQHPPRVEKRPDLQWNVEFLHHRREPPEIAEVSFTARAEPESPEQDVDELWNRDADDWQVCHRRHSTPRNGELLNTGSDHQAVAGTLENDFPEIPGEPLYLPDSAPEVVEIELELAWNHAVGSASPRHRPNHLVVRNAGPHPVERVDVVVGSLAESLPELPSLVSRTLRQLAPGEGETVPVGGRRLVRTKVLSVVATAFVGGVTDVAEDVAPLPSPPGVVSQPEPEPRPHLKLTAGKPDRLPEFHMLSLPIRVLNDGNVALRNVIVVARVPSSLSHRYGAVVHYRVGHLRAGEERDTTLLLTALEAGTASLPLSVADGDQTASDALEAHLHVVAKELDLPLKAATSTRNGRTKVADDSF